MSDSYALNDVPEIELSSYTLDPAVLSLVPASLAQKYKLIPLFKVGNTLTIAMANPRNILALDEVHAQVNMEVNYVKSTEREIEEAISEYYGIQSVVEDVLKEYQRTEDIKPVKALEEESPIVKLVNAIVTQAIAQKASDIHIEPEAKGLRVRYRIDGLLHEELRLPSYILNAIVSRIKVLSEMDIAESRVPQDGRFNMTHNGKSIDFRISTFPSVYGEKVVMRILDKSAIMYRLTEIGFSEENLARFKKATSKPHGVILVTGPTGSGKTTTLYATLAELNSKEFNIVTVEDPVEYELAGITQAQVNVKAGLTFASALKSILRQDPDIILIGEIRDTETANIAIQSALTGHLVFSTLHTNDSSGAVSRMQEMGVEAFLIASSLDAVLAQRLVRLICKKCKMEVPVPEPIKKRFPDLQTMYKGKGCKACKGTGYKGRIGIFELFVVDDNIRKLISDKRNSSEIKAAAISSGMKTLFDDGIDKVKQGITSLDEVLRVTELEQL